MIVLFAVGLLWPAASLAAGDRLSVLAEIRPWPMVSRMIGFGDRLWFANSVKGVNHNSADLHSYDPKTGETRFERHLFSQDAGRPLVAQGLLYWPFEDARVSLGVGHFMVTDGEHWRQGVIPSGRIFHAHAMAAPGEGHLVAATSAWRAHLDLSADQGASWRQIYDHPTPEGRVTRIVDLATLDGAIFGYLSSADQRGLMRIDGKSAEPVPGWPPGRPVTALTVFQDHVYALVRMPDGSAVWRTDGVASEQMASLADFSLQRSARDLIADERGLWLLAANDRDGSIWQSADGRDWTRRLHLDGGRAIELSSYQGQLFVAGGDDERSVGLLWGAPPDAATVSLSDDEPTEALPRSPGDLPARLPPSSVETDWAAAGAEMDALLADPSTYEGRGRLRDVVFELAGAAPPKGFFAERLQAPMPDVPMSLIGGAVQVPALYVGRAVLLWGMTLLGRDAISPEHRVPLNLLSAPWTRPANRAEKYFDSQPLAIWTVGNTGQNDIPTLDALVSRLDQEGDPLWLRGDVVGALTALTGQRFGYDVQAWQRWWDETRPVWSLK